MNRSTRTISVRLMEIRILPLMDPGISGLSECKINIYSQFTRVYILSDRIFLY